MTPALEQLIADGRVRRVNPGAAVPLYETVHPLTVGRTPTVFRGRRRVEAHLKHESVLTKPSLWRRPIVRVGLSLAALLLVAIVARPLIAPDETLRGDGARITGIAPKGELHAPPSQFTWTRSPAAARYRFELYDEESRLRGRRRRNLGPRRLARAHSGSRGSGVVLVAPVCPARVDDWLPTWSRLR